MRRTMNLGMSLILASTAMVAQARPADDPLLRPIEPEFAQRWLTPQAPMRIHGRSWLIGFGGLNIALISTSAGLILIDGGVPQGVLAVEEKIRGLGFKIQDVKLILSTEPHYDHAGGIPALARDSGATVIASRPATAALRTGRVGTDDPQHAWLVPFPPVKRLRAVDDGETIKLGDTVVTAVATPGHTAGSMSWTWKSCEKGQCVDMVFASSLNPVAAPGYRFSDPASRATVAGFRATVGKMRALPCDILFSAHPDQSGGDAKAARFELQPQPNPFVDPGACRAYADKFAGLLDKRLADEAAGTVK